MFQFASTWPCDGLFSIIHLMDIVFSSLDSEPVFSHQVLCTCKFFPFTITDKDFCAVYYPILLPGRRILHSHTQLLAGLFYLREKGTPAPGERGPHPDVFLRPSSTIAQRSPRGSSVRGLCRWAGQHVSCDGIHFGTIFRGLDRGC